MSTENTRYSRIHNRTPTTVGSSPRAFRRKVNRALTNLSNLSSLSLTRTRSRTSVSAFGTLTHLDAPPVPAIPRTAPPPHTEKHPAMSSTSLSSTSSEGLSPTEANAKSRRRRFWNALVGSETSSSSRLPSELRTAAQYYSLYSMDPLLIGCFVTI